MGNSCNSAPIQWGIEIAAAILVAIMAAPMGSEAADNVGGRQLAHAKMSGRDFRGADLTNADLTMADFSRADLRGAKLAGAKLDRTNLDDSDLRGVIGWGESGPGFGGVSANRANLSDTDLRGALVEGFFEGADLRGADLTNATLHGRFHDAKFDGATVTGAVMVRAQGTEANHEDLRSRGAIVSASDFSAAVKAGRDFSRYKLTAASLRNVNLDGAQLRGADMHSANITGTTLRGANLRGAMLSFCDAQDARFDGADLAQTLLFYIRAEKSTFDGANLQGMTLYGADLKGASLRNVDLTGADLSYADLSGADLTGAVLDGIKVNAAILDGVRGVEPKTLSRLRGEAARWKHNLFTSFEWFVSNLSLPLHLIVTPFLGIMSVAGFCRSRGGKRASFGVLATLNGLSVIPFLAALVLGALGGSPIAQMSDPHLWSAWFRLHGMLAVGMLLLITASLICASFHLVRYVFMCCDGLKALSSIVALFTPVNCLLAFGVLALMAPDA